MFNFNGNVFQTLMWRTLFGLARVISFLICSALEYDNNRYAKSPIHPEFSRCGLMAPSDTGHQVS